MRFSPNLIPRSLTTGNTHPRHQQTIVAAVAGKTVTPELAYRATPENGKRHIVLPIVSRDVRMPTPIPRSYQTLNAITCSAEMYRYCHVNADDFNWFLKEVFERCSAKAICLNRF